MSTYRSRLRNEQGMALIGVILLLILASGVCAALAVSGKTETMAAYNLDTSAQARAAAQAGLTAAIEVVITNLNATGLAPTDAVNNLLEGPDDDAAATADNGSLAVIDGGATGLPAPGATLGLGTLQGVSYTVQAFDEDDSARGLTLSGAAITEIDENNVATTDNNRKIVIRATGFGRNNTTVTLEAIIGTTTLPAIVANGDIEIHGSVEVSGQNGGVHANGNVTTQGNAFDIAKDLTATGVIDDDATDNVGGDTLESQPVKDIPSLQADWDELKTHVSYFLGNDGLVRATEAGAPLCGSVAACAATYKWSWGGGGNWNLNSTPPTGTYHMTGMARITGSPGPVTMSILAEGDIDIQGSPDLQPNSAANFDTLFATKGDLEISGNLESPLIEGVVRVLGQLKITGNPTIAGQILIENEPVGTLATAIEIGGNTTITYNGIAGNDTFNIAGWREIK